MSNQISTTKEYFNKIAVKQKFEEILGGNRAAAFMTSVLQIVSNNELLKKADPSSVFNAAVTAAVLDLPLNDNLGFAYIVPYNDRKTGKQIAKLLIGYKGFKQLAVRSGQYHMMDAKVVYEGQIIADHSFQGFHFDWSKRETDKIVGYVSYFRLLNGYESLYFMDAFEMKAHAKQYSPTFKNGKGLWVEDYDKMALKTVTRLHLNDGDAPLSIEMQKAVVEEPEHFENEVNMEESDEEQKQRMVTYIKNSTTLEQLELVSEHLYDYGLTDLYNARKKEIIDGLKHS